MDRRSFVLTPVLTTPALLSGSLLASSLMVTSALAAPSVGQKAPDFSATDLSGKSHKLSDFAGKYVVLEWTNPNCPFVKKHYNSANMQGLQKEFTAKGVVWLAINSTEKQHEDYLAAPQLVSWLSEKVATPTAMLMDAEGQIGQLYGARTTPHMYIISPSGELVYAGGIDSIASGRADDIKTATNYVRQGLGEALAGKPISVATSKPYGCSVKYKA